MGAMSVTNNIPVSTILVASIFVLVVLVILAERCSDGSGFGVWIGMARLLRRIGRWFWAAGEGLERGYQHGQSVKRRINLDMDASLEGKEQQRCPMNG